MHLLHVGCGTVYLDGWINLDLDAPKIDLKHNLTQKLPFVDNSIDFIYSEHVIEHFTVQQGLALLREFYRVLKPGGVVRIATPDLKYTLFRYFYRWHHQEWIKRYGYEWIETGAEMVNIALREWGHQYLYDQEELTRRLQEAGFTTVDRKKIQKSDYSPLRSKETRQDSKLILEARK